MIFNGNPPTLVSVRPNTDSYFNIAGVYTLTPFTHGISFTLIRSTYSYPNTLVNALLALKIGKEDIYVSRYIQGVNKRVMTVQSRITKANCVMVGHLSSVVYSPMCHCQFYVCVRMFVILTNIYK